MAKYLKPRRGTKTNATNNNIVLKKGEMFLCMSNNDNIGKGPGSLYIGDGASSFSQYAHDGSTVANTAQPFLIHPVLYKPIFANTNPASSGWTFNDGTAEIATIGDGTGRYALPAIIGSIKGALCKHADSLNRLNQDLHYAKYIDTGIFESDLNDFTDHGYYVFARNSTPNNCPDDWTAAEPFVLQVIRDENAKDSRVDSNIDCQQIIYYGDDTYMRTAKWENVTVSGTTIFKLVWSEWSKHVAINTMLDIIYPVGSLYLAANASIDPNNFLPGTWQRFSANYVLKTITTGDSATAAAGNTGSTTLTINQIPSHGHTFSSNQIVWQQSSGYGQITPGSVTSANRANITNTAGTVGVNGGGQGHTHTAGMPANIGVHVWKRTP